MARSAATDYIKQLTHTKILTTKEEKHAVLRGKNVKYVVVFGDTYQTRGSGVGQKLPLFDFVSFRLFRL